MILWRALGGKGLFAALIVGLGSYYPGTVRSEAMDETSPWRLNIEPSLLVSSRYDSNLYRQADDRNKSDDWLLQISPHIVAAATSGIFLAQVEMDYSAGRYSEFSEDNFNDYWLETDLRWQLNHRNQLRLVARESHLHEDRGTELTEGDFSRVSAPIEFDSSRYMARYQLGTPQSTGRLVTWIRYYDKQYQNFRAITEQRDYNELTGQAEFYWRVAGRTLLQFQLTATETDYDVDPLPQDGVGDTLDSRTGVLLAGAAWGVTGKSGLSILMGYRKRNFNDPDREDFDGPSWRISANWAPLDYSRLDFETAQEDKETNGLGSFINSERYHFGWSLDWNSRFGTELTSTLVKDQYEGVIRTDRNWFNEFKIEYHMRYWLDFGISFAHEVNESDVARFEFERSLVQLYGEIHTD